MGGGSFGPDAIRHAGYVHACAYSPDGGLIATASADKTVKLWNAETGALFKTLEGHTADVSACAWSPDGRLIASAAQDGTLRVWDVDSCAELAALAGYSPTGRAVGWEQSVTGACFSPDGRLLLSTCSDGTLKLWDAVSLIERSSPPSGFRWPYCCAFAPTGCRILCGEAGDRLTIWSVPAGELLWEYRGAGLSASWSPDGRRIAAGARSGQVHLLELRGGNERLSRAAP